MLQQAAGRWKNQKVAAAWLAWRDKYLEAMRIQALLHRAAGRWKNQALSAAFQKWYAVTDFTQRRQVRLVVQDMKPLQVKGQYLARGSRYGIAIAESGYEDDFEYSSKAQPLRHEGQLGHDLSPSRSAQHSMTPRGHAVIRSHTPRGKNSPQMSPRENIYSGRSGEVLLVRSSETSLCLSWLATGKQPHTLLLGGPDGIFKPIAILDPEKDKHNSQLCFTITHLQPLKTYEVRVDIGNSPGIFTGLFQTQQSNGPPQRGDTTNSPTKGFGKVSVSRSPASNTRGSNANTPRQTPRTPRAGGMGEFGKDIGKSHTPRTPRGSVANIGKPRTPRTPRTVSSGPNRALF